MKDLIIIFLTGLLACTNDIRLESFKEEPAVVKEVLAPDTVILGDKLTFKLRFYIRNSCFAFKRIDMTEAEGNAYHFTVWIYDPNQFSEGVMCMTSVFVEEIEETITLDQMGDYFLYFNEGKLIKKITVI